MVDGQTPSSEPHPTNSTSLLSSSLNLISNWSLPHSRTYNPPIDESTSPGVRSSSSPRRPKTSPSTLALRVEKSSPSKSRSTSTTSGPTLGSQTQASSSTSDLSCSPPPSPTRSRARFSKTNSSASTLPPNSPLATGFSKTHPTSTELKRVGNSSSIKSSRIGTSVLLSRDGDKSSNQEDELQSSSAEKGTSQSPKMEGKHTQEAQPRSSTIDHQSGEPDLAQALPLRPPPITSNSYHSSTQSATTTQPFLSHHHRSTSQHSFSHSVKHNKRISFARNVNSGNNPAPKLMLPPLITQAIEQEMEEQKKQQEARKNLAPSGGRGGAGTRNRLGFRLKRPKTAPAAVPTAASIPDEPKTSSTATTIDTSAITAVPSVETQEIMSSSGSMERRSQEKRSQRQPSETGTSGSEAQEILNSAEISRSNSSNDFDTFGPVSFLSRNPSSRQSDSILGPSPLSASPLASTIELPTEVTSTSEIKIGGQATSPTDFNADKLSSQLQKQKEKQEKDEELPTTTGTLPSQSTKKPRSSKRPSSAGGVASGKWTSNFLMGGRKRTSSDASVKSLPMPFPAINKDAEESMGGEDGRISHTRLESLPPPPRSFYPGTLILVRDRSSSSSSKSDESGDGAGETKKREEQQDSPQPSPIVVNSLAPESNENQASSLTLNAPTTPSTLPARNSMDSDDGSATSIDSGLLEEGQKPSQFAELVPTTSHPRSPGGRKILWNGDSIRNNVVVLDPPPAPSPAPKVEVLDEDSSKPISTEEKKLESHTTPGKKFKSAGKAIRAFVKFLGKSSEEKNSSKKGKGKARLQTGEDEERLYDENGNVKTWVSQGKTGQSASTSNQEDVQPSASSVTPKSSRRFQTGSNSLTKSLRSKVVRALSQDKYERTSSMRIVSSQDLGAVNSILLSPISSMHGHSKARSVVYNEFGSREDRDGVGGRVRRGSGPPALNLSLPAPIHRSSRSGSTGGASIGDGPPSRHSSTYSHSPSLPNPTPWDLAPPQSKPRSSRGSVSRSNSRRESFQSSKAVANSSATPQKVQIQSPVTAREKKMMDEEDDQLAKTTTRDSMRGTHHDLEGGAEHYL